MTKKLLTALLIAGISVTVKAEPVVYYCEMKVFAELTADGEIRRYKNERFPMKVEERRVSFGGDGFMSNHSETLRASFVPSQGFFISEGGTWFENNILTSSSHSLGESVASFVARCDKF